MLEARRFAVPIVAIAVVAAAAALAWLFGPAEQGYFDSAFYVDGARHLARAEGYVSAYAELAGHDAYQPITHWAPGTSLLMAPLIALGVPPLTAAAWVVGACYVGAALLIFLLGVALAGERAWPLSVLVSLLFLLQPSTRRWLNAVLSDVPWAAFALLSVYLGMRVMRSQRASLGLRIALGLSLWWLVLVRYAGLLFLPGLLAAVVLGGRTRDPFWKRPLFLWPVLLTAAPGIALWNFRNKLVSNNPLGGWSFAISGVHAHLSRAFRSTASWTDQALEAAAPLGVASPMRYLLFACALSLVPLTLVAIRRCYRQLGLLVIPAFAYFAALVFAASVTVIAKLSETRFWIVIWPLSWLAMIVVVMAARARWCLGFKAVVVSTLSCVLIVYAAQAYRELPTSREPRGLLHPAWARAAEVLPDAQSCFVLVNDPRPFMLHRALPPISQIPRTLDEFRAAEVRAGRELCIVTTDASRRLRLSSGAERMRQAQNEVIEALKAQQRLKQAGRRAGVTVYRVQ